MVKPFLDVRPPWLLDEFWFAPEIIHTHKKTVRLMTIPENWYFECNNAGYVWEVFHQEASEIGWSRMFVPVALLTPVFSLYPRRAMLSITAFLLSSFPQKDSITGMVNEFFVPECTTLTQQRDNDIHTNTKSHCNHGGPELIIPLKTAEQKNWFTEKGRMQM